MGRGVSLRGVSCRPSVKKRLQDQDGSHSVNHLPTASNAEFRIAQHTVGFGGRQALIPEVDGELEVPAQLFGKLRHFVGLHTFGAAQPQRESDYNFRHLVRFHYLVQVFQVQPLVLAMESLQTLGGQPERIRDRHPDALGTDIQTQNASDGNWVSFVYS